MARSFRFLGWIGTLSLLAAAWTRAQAQERGCPGWHEPLGQDRAGSLPLQAKTECLTPTLQGRLDGHYTGPNGPYDDFEDMFFIRIVEPQGFFVKTVPPTDPSAGAPLANTMLWLFLPNNDSDPLTARGLLANDDTPFGLTTPGSPFSLIDFGDMPNLPPDCYFLAISGSDNNPVGQGLRIWNLPPTGVFAPNGPGAALPIDSWDHGGQNLFGAYEIQMGGVGAEPCVIPEPASLLLVSWGLLLMGRRRRGYGFGVLAVRS